MESRLCQFTEILVCPDYVNLQRFHGAPTTSIYRDFMAPRLRQFTEILCCPNVNLQRFYGVPTMSIYRDFSVPYYVNLQRFCRYFMLPRLRRFTEILWCPDYVNLQRSRDHDLREPIPHTWASSNDNLFQSNFSTWSSREAILGTTSDWPT